MRRSQKKAMFKWLFALIAIFAVLVYAIPMFTLAVDASALVTDVWTFFDDIKTELTTNYAVIATVLGIIAVSYYFLIQKPKLKR